MQKKTHLRRAVAGLVVILAAGGASVAIAQSSGPGRPGHFDHISLSGRPIVSFSGDDAAMLGRAGVPSVAQAVGERGRFSFLLTQTDARRCLLVAGAGTHHLDAVFCETRGGFPSDAEPVFDVSISDVDPASGAQQLDTLAGIAADGVTKVGVIGANGRLKAVPVVGNVYALEGVNVANPKTLVAFDAMGAQIYRHDFG